MKDEFFHLSSFLFHLLILACAAAARPTATARAAAPASAATQRRDIAAIAVRERGNFGYFTRDMLTVTGGAIGGGITIFHRAFEFEWGIAIGTDKFIVRHALAPVKACAHFTHFGAVRQMGVGFRCSTRSINQRGHREGQAFARFGNS